jgi:trehalose utilization protein
MSDKIRITVWNENLHERTKEKVMKVYPNGIHNAIADGLKKNPDMTVRTATLEQPEHGLTEKVLDETDVLFWWGHMAHDQVEDAIVKRVQERVLSGMGLIVLHSGHFSKIFKLLMGTHCSLRWREAGEKELVWNVAPGHPITKGIGDTIVIPAHEMYGERFDIPEPTQLVFISWYEGGNVFRSGCTFIRGNGRIFYFSPGHETYPVYFDDTIRKILTNAARWAMNESKRDFKLAPRETVPLMEIGKK